MNETKKPLEVIIILDRSGSMQNVRSETIEGLNAYFAKLKNDENNDYTISLTMFDFVDEKMCLDRKVNRVELADYRPLTLEDFEPRGLTPLYDAIGTTVVDYLHENKGSRDVICVVMTDGMENASREFSSSSLRSLIEERESAGWQFVFLGADINAWDAVGSFALSKGNSASFGKGEMHEAMCQMAIRTTRFAGTGRKRSADFFKETDDADDSSVFRPDEKD